MFEASDISPYLMIRFLSPISTADFAITRMISSFCALSAYVARCLSSVRMISAGLLLVSASAFCRSRASFSIGRLLFLCSRSKDSESQEEDK